MATDETGETPVGRLAPLVGHACEIERLCSRQTLGRLEEHWQRLLDLGFELELGSQTLQIRNRNANFETVIQFGSLNDLEDRRQLFDRLNRAFGGFWSRFSWLLRPRPAVTAPYESLRAVVSCCQAIRARAWPAQPPSP